MMLLVDPNLTEDMQEKYRKGLLIDFDYACDLLRNANVEDASESDCETLYPEDEDDQSYEDLKLPSDYESGYETPTLVDASRSTSAFGTYDKLTDDDEVTLISDKSSVGKKSRKGKSVDLSKPIRDTVLFDSDEDENAYNAKSISDDSEFEEGQDELEANNYMRRRGHRTVCAFSFFILLSHQQKVRVLVHL